MKNLLLGFLFAVSALGLTVSAQAQSPHFVPSSTKVAIIPTINSSGETWDKLKLGMPKRSDDYQREQFAKKGFVLIDRETINNAIRSLNLDMSDEENWKRDVLRKIGSKLGADLVTFAVITSSDQKLESRNLTMDRQGSASVKYWLYDMSQKKSIIPGHVITEHSGGSIFAGLDKGSDRKIRATANAVRDHLKPFLDEYPER